MALNKWRTWSRSLYKNRLGQGSNPYPSCYRLSTLTSWLPCPTNSTQDIKIQIILQACLQQKPDGTIQNCKMSLPTNCTLQTSLSTCMVNALSLVLVLKFYINTLHNFLKCNKISDKFLFTFTHAYHLQALAEVWSLQVLHTNSSTNNRH